MKKVKGNHIVNSTEYVREPVDKEVNTILDLNISKIILTGGRGVGKTTVLCAMEDRGLGSKEQTIYMCPDAAVISTTEPDKHLNEDGFKYLYELRFTNQVLSYIKRNYPIIYEKYFINDAKFVHNLLNELVDSINRSSFDDVIINCKYSSNDLVIGVLDKFCEKMNIEKINLAIDRFDQAHGSSEYVQKIYEDYFILFDKTILVTDDPTINVDMLKNKGYAVRTISYGSDEDNISAIIKQRKSLYNEKNGCFAELYTLPEFLDKLSIFGADIDSILDVLYEMPDYIDICDHDIEKALDRAIDHVIASKDSIDRITAKPKLYL